MFGTDQPNVSYVRDAEIIRLVDGDTIEALIDDGCKRAAVEMLRLVGVDTPETRGPETPAGLYVVERAVEFFGLPDNTDIIIDSQNFKVDSFARVIAEVWQGGRSYNQWLLDEGLAWPTDARGRLTVRRDVELLDIPTEIKQAVWQMQVRR